MKQTKYILSAVVALLLASGTALFAQPQSENRDGFYKEIFMDSGLKLSSRKYLPSARHLQKEVEIFWHNKNTLRDTLMQYKCFVGTEMDSNGILMYPDGAPRFRVVYVNGGLAASHARTLGPEGQERYREYVSGGGSFVGTCAGGYIGTTGVYQKDGTFKHRPEYFALWPGRARDTHWQTNDLQCIWMRIVLCLNTMILAEI